MAVPPEVSRQLYRIRIGRRSRRNGSSTTSRPSRARHRRVNPGFSPAWWLPGPHLQTAWGSIARSRRRVAFVREVLTTPDGDDLVLDHVEGAAGSARLVVLHGLEGSSYSVYVQGFLAAAARLGWRGTALNFRS